MISGNILVFHGKTSMSKFRRKFWAFADLRYDVCMLATFCIYETKSLHLFFPLIIVRFYIPILNNRVPNSYDCSLDTLLSQQKPLKLALIDTFLFSAVDESLNIYYTQIILLRSLSNSSYGGIRHVAHFVGDPAPLLIYKYYNPRVHNFFVLTINCVYIFDCFTHLIISTILNNFSHMTN